MSTPVSDIVICSGVPLNNTYEHTLYFDNATAQAIYFIGKKKTELVKYTFLRPERKIKVVGDFADAYTWNYLFFQNADNKRFYHFINRVEYINDNTVELEIELDVMQTFMFDWDLKPCLIERTHTLTDEFGEHTIPEGLETGPLVSYQEHHIELDDCYIMILDTEGGGAGMYGGVYSGLRTWAIDPANEEAMGYLSLLLANLNDTGTIDRIVNMWMYPKELVIVGESSSHLKPVLSVGSSPTKSVKDPFHGNKLLNGEAVQNSKTKTFPYTQVYVSNNMGGCATYRREWFNQGALAQEVVEEGNITFKVWGALSPDSGASLVPKYYKNVQGFVDNFEEALALPAFPSCAWVSDTYKVWLAQNMASQEQTIRAANMNVALGFASLLGGVATSIATLNPTGAVAGGATAINTMNSAYNTVQGIMAQRQDMSVQPDQARGHHSASVNMNNSRMGFSVYFLCTTPEYTRSIDEYFTRYGYKVNKFAKPTLKNRSVFTYIKTAGAHVTGAMGANYQRQIQAIFDKGLTFWARPEAVGNYSLNELLPE